VRRPSQNYKGTLFRASTQRLTILVAGNPRRLVRYFTVQKQTPGSSTWLDESVWAALLRLATSFERLTPRRKSREPLKRSNLRRDRNAAIGPANAGRRMLANDVEYAVLNAGLATGWDSVCGTRIAV
jgi:hypothetical protein